MNAYGDEWTRVDCGQMSVEAAVVFPVVLVCAFVVANLMSFIDCCAAFENIASQAIVSQGVSPPGSGNGHSNAAIRSCIESALGRGQLCSVEVTSEDISRFGKDVVFDLSPRFVRYTCVLHFHPWPGSFVIAGVQFSPPELLTYRTSLVVDVYRSGVLV